MYVYCLFVELNILTKKVKTYGLCKRLGHILYLFKVFVVDLFLLRKCNLTVCYTVSLNAVVNTSR